MFFLYWQWSGWKLTFLTAYPMTNTVGYIRKDNLSCSSTAILLVCVYSKQTSFTVVDIAAEKVTHVSNVVTYIYIYIYIWIICLKINKPQSCMKHQHRLSIFARCIVQAGLILHNFFLHSIASTCKFRPCFSFML